MKRKIMLLIITLCFILTGCGERTVEKDGTYFVKISSEREGDVIYDSRTKVQYWRSCGCYNEGSLTMLVDADGKPLLYKESD
jgi:protein involved in sex pheromone biosynthesis